MGVDKELEELLRIASSSPEEVEPLNEAEKFVFSLGIKPGNTRITTSHVYYTYKQWTKDPPLSKRTFLQQFRKLFKQKRTKSIRFYKLSPEPFDMSDETYYLVRAEVRQERIANGQFRPKEKDEKK